MSHLPVNEATRNREELLLSLWSKAGGSNPNTLSPWTYKRPTVISSPKPRFCALLIGINHYRSQTLRPLRGAVADALAFKEYLEVDLGIPTSNIDTLLNRFATREAIIGALVRLKNDERTSKGDPILIFYAGYGGEAQSSESPLTKERCIVPYDYSEHQGLESEAIGHRAIALLVSQIVETKGDNVTLIFDCSYSPLASYQPDEFSPIRVRYVPLRPLKSSDGLLTANVWSTDASHAQLEKSHPHDEPSYTLISACSSSEVARETYGRGNFSKAVLNLLRHSSPHELSYLDIIARIDQIPGQTPQCIGHNKSRSLFDAKVAVTQQTCFHLTNSDGQFILHAGTIHGITSGAQFTVYANDDFSFNTPLRALNVESLGAFTTTLAIPPTSNTFAVPQSALALQTKLGTLEDIRFYIPLDDRLHPVYEALVDLMRGNHTGLENVVLVDSPSNAHVEIAEENGKAVFLIRDQRITQYGLTRLCEGVELTVEDIIPVLKAAAHYYWKINRTNTNPDISTSIQVEFYKLDDLSIDSFGGSDLVPSGPNLYHNNLVEFVVEEDCPYGLNLTNNSAYDLYPYMFYFDNSDLSVGAYYQPSAIGNPSLGPPLKKNGGTLSIGYGAGGAAPFAYYLRDNQDLDVGFLKLFLATEPVDLSNIPQSTPFEISRSAERFSKSKADTWSTILIPVVQHRSPPNSKKCVKCGHVTVDEAKLTAIAFKEENDELKHELDLMEAKLIEEQRLHEMKLKSVAEQLESVKETMNDKNLPKPQPPTRKGSIFSIFSIGTRKSRFWWW